ncbi:MAG: trypsin-like peptidase domain-containing protein [Burkholderiales bacterium]|nr:MAG: trypsin-like peptidase domain-containing protein [Burkholderiales bacterium]
MARSAAAAGPSEAGSADGSARDTGRARSRMRGAWRARLRERAARHQRPLLFAAGAAFAGLLLVLYHLNLPQPSRLTQQDIDDAVLHTLRTAKLPSRAARAAEIVAPSVVRVRQIREQEDLDPADAPAADAHPGTDEDLPDERAVGTGVVILEEGVILTNLHVVAGGQQVGVVFSNGFESDARVIGVQAENDLAVLRARTVPDDLVAATLRSTADLRPGDEVAAVGFPFGIGPSVSSGVVSGLKREFRSSDGEKLISNLIQFDAAANPGNSGGPLVTMDGEVVGIVTSILNPTEQRVFIGIGFAVPIENAARAVGMVPF